MATVKEDRRIETVQLRLTPAEKTKLAAAAKAKRLTVSDLVRDELSKFLR